MSILASSLTLGAADYSWRDHALCRDTDPELFFPVGTTGTALVQIERAKQVCGECTARVECLDFALTHEPGLGCLGRAVRGGASGDPPPARRPGPQPRRRLTASTDRRRGTPSARSARSTSTDRDRSSSGRTRAHGDVDAALGRPAGGQVADEHDVGELLVPARLRRASARSSLERRRRRRRAAAAAPSTSAASWLRLRTTRELGVRDVERARGVAQAGRDEADVVDDGVDRLGRSPISTTQLVADAVAVLEQHRQAGEVVVDLVLAADGDGRPR